MKLKIKVGEMATHLIETNVKADGSFDLLHNGQLVSTSGSGRSQIDALRSFSDDLIYGELLDKRR